MKWFDWFLNDGSAFARLIRTLAEVILAWLLANVGEITGLFNLEPTPKALLISALTIVLTAIIGFVNDNSAKNLERKEDKNANE